jgi:deoxycytidylate deaminase
MDKGLDLSHIYSLRNDFTVIGLTGQIGSGCSEVAEQLEKGFKEGNYEDPLEVGLDRTVSPPRINHNSYRKYRIVYNYAKYKDNFTGYARINYKDILIVFLLKHPFESLIDFLRNSPQIKKEFNSMGISSDFEAEIRSLGELKLQFNKLSSEFKSINIQQIKVEGNWDALYKFYFQSEFLQFSKTCLEALKKISRIKRNKFLQLISSNLRRSGNPFNFTDSSAVNIFTIVELINLIIKSQRKCPGLHCRERTQIVIDDLRSPIEIMYFKQRYAAFYTIAVNRDPYKRQEILGEKYNSSPDTYDVGEKLWKDEYDGAKNYEFYKANISACIQQADIHISFLTKEESVIKNEEIQKQNSLSHTAKDVTSPYFTWKMQLLKYVSLISHPGLITPSPEERCMQMAYTAKHNSGCISRHVGAAITDEHYSIKAIGWNNTPSGQVPCVLRNAEDLLGNKNDVAAFTDYEKEYFIKNKNTHFFSALDNNFRGQINENKENLKGRNVCFCFKDVKNSYSEGKNQVHTRSLHAEESAFLQITKYGGTGIENGKLFTTASPCELCAKKAYQLGIKVIYYIDPYPGISDEHILSSGNKAIKPRLFNGAIGNAYHWLYDSIMPYKDELTLLLNNKIYDYASQQKMEVEKKDIKISELEARIKELENK